MEVQFEVVFKRERYVLADVAPIRIGTNTHFRDNVVVHVDSPPNQIPTYIGDNCFIGNPRR